MAVCLFLWMAVTFAELLQMIVSFYKWLSAQYYHGVETVVFRIFDGYFLAACVGDKF